MRLSSLDKTLYNLAGSLSIQEASCISLSVAAIHGSINVSMVEPYGPHHVPCIVLPMQMKFKKKIHWSITSSHLLILWSFQIPLHESVKETPVIQQLEQEEHLSADGQAGEVPYEEEQEDIDEEEEPEGQGSEPEAPLEDVSGEPAESGNPGPPLQGSL